MGVNYVYALLDPFTLQYRYIGKTNNPNKRYRNHFAPYYLKADTYKNRWLKKCLAQNVKPSMIIMSEVYEEYGDDINDVERYWIALFRRIGYPLTNGTIGGDGGPMITGRKVPKPIGWISPMTGIKWEEDDPRREEIRQRQLGIPPMQATIKAIEKNKFNWLIIDPNGIEYHAHGLTNFCKIYNLSASKMAAVARGEKLRTHHKGWKCQKIIA